MTAATSTKNLLNVIEYAFHDISNSIWKFLMRRQDRFKYFKY